MLAAPALICLFLVALWAVLFARGLSGISKTPVVRPHAESSAAVTVYMPARDEGGVIAETVDAVLAQGEAVTSFVVVDDGSTDGTAEVVRARFARDARGRLVSSPGPAAGECGKPAALAFAVTAAPAATEWLLFLDADVRLSPGAVSGLLQLARDRGADLLSVIPQMELGSVLERIVMPSVGALILARHPPEAVADPARAIAFANGQVVLLKREVYERVGGHASVVRELLEDVRLAERVKASGGRLVLADGRLVARTRMYESWAELSEGWIKNLFLLMGASGAGVVAWAALTLILGMSPWVALALGGWPIGVASYLAILVMQVVLRWRGGGAAPAWAVAAPIGALLAVYLLVRSARRARRGGVPWKGRTYG